MYPYFTYDNDISGALIPIPIKPILKIKEMEYRDNN